MVDIETLSRAQLAEIVEIYPWFTAARSCLCTRTLEVSGREAAMGLYRESVAYLPCGERVSACIISASEKDYSDTDASINLREIIEKRSRSLYDGTDYFSRNDYDSVRKIGDGSFGKLAKVDYSSPAPDFKENVHNEECNLVSETLAEIYAEQGYPERAIEIYNALSLQSPEKSAYFASLIGKLKS